MTELQNAIACAGRVLELIEQESETPDAADAFVLKKADGTVDINDVSFSYEPEQSLIENFNMRVAADSGWLLLGRQAAARLR